MEKMSRGYGLWCSDLQKFIISRDVTFYEEALLKAKCKSCKDGSPIWRGDDYNEELDVHASV